MDISEKLKVDSPEYVTELRGFSSIYFPLHVEMEAE